MEKLARVLTDYHDPEGDEKKTISETCPELHNAALHWAEYSVMTYKGPTLRRALDVSAALADFVAHMDDLCRQ